MSENPPGDLPPDLPPEYAEAYRRGYERARRRAAGEIVEDEPEPTTVTESRPLFVDEVEPDPPAVLPGGAHRAEPEPFPEPAPAPVAQAYEPDDELLDDEAPPRPRPTWLAPALLAGLVLVLLLGAYLVGRVLSDNLSSSQGSPKQPDGVVMSEDGSTGTPSASAKPSTTPSAKPSATPSKRPGKPYAGRTEAAIVTGATASCEAPPGVDAAGHPVRYSASNVYDQDMTTAWRCDGSGVGQRLVIRLGGPTRIGEVGLIPGYAKTDPSSHVDRYAENNRLTRVRWTFDDGTTVVQTLDPSAGHRSMQSKRIPVTRSGTATVTVLGSQRGPRNTIAVSEVRIGRTAG